MGCSMQDAYATLTLRWKATRGLLNHSFRSKLPWDMPLKRWNTTSDSHWWHRAHKPGSKSSRSPLTPCTHQVVLFVVDHR